jgi:hypothetical protein
MIDFMTRYSQEARDEALSDEAFEFICRLYVESKKYLSKKEKSLIIFGRIFDLFDQITGQLNPEHLKLFIEPILSLIYRIKTNRLIDEVIKDRSNLTFEKLSKKYVKDESFNETYKNVTKSINLLRRKRKTEVMQQAITNPKQFIEKRKENKKKV